MRSLRQWFDEHAKQPVDVPRTFQAVASVLFAASALVAVLVVYVDKQGADSRAESIARDLTAANAKIDKQQSITDCRSQLSTAVTDSTTTYSFAIGQNVLSIEELVLAIANHTSIPIALSDLAMAQARLRDAGVVLDAARQARVAFELMPTGGCDGGSARITTTPTTIAGGNSTTGTTLTVTLNRASTTTTGPPPVTAPRGSTTTTSTTRPPNPPTTAPLCHLVPVTVPGAPCL